MHYLDILCCALLLGSLFHGFRQGMVDQLLSLLSLIGAIYFSRLIIPYVLYYTSGTAGVISWGVAFIISWLVLSIVRGLLSPLLSRPLGFLDKITGALLSLFVTMLILGLLLQGWERIADHYPVPRVPDTLLFKEILLDLGRTFWPDQLLLHRTTRVGGEGTTLV